MQIPKQMQEQRITDSKNIQKELKITAERLIVLNRNDLTEWGMYDQ